MRRLILACALAGAVVAAPLAAVASKAAPAAAAKGKLATTNLSIGGMTCQGCASGIQRQVLKVNGVKTAKLDHVKKSGSFEYDPKVCKPADILAAVKKSGYTASLAK